MIIYFLNYFLKNTTILKLIPIILFSNLFNIEKVFFGRFFFFGKFGGHFTTFKFELHFEKIICAFWKLNIVKGPLNCSKKVYRFGTIVLCTSPHKSKDKIIEKVFMQKV